MSIRILKVSLQTALIIIVVKLPTVLFLHGHPLYLQKEGMDNKLPLTVRRAIELMGLYFLGTLIFIGRDIITPLVMAFFLAIILLPVYRWLRRRKLPEGMAIALSLLVMIIVV